MRYAPPSIEQLNQWLAKNHILDRDPDDTQALFSAHSLETLSPRQLNALVICSEGWTFVTGFGDVARTMAIRGYLEPRAVWYHHQTMIQYQITFRGLQFIKAWREYQEAKQESKS